MSELRSGTAAARWADALEQWAIPQHIMDAAPEGPWRFPPAVFAWTPQRAAAERPLVTLSRQRALDALGEGGTVLDVGAEGGRATFPWPPRRPWWSPSTPAPSFSAPSPRRPSARASPTGPCTASGPCRPSGGAPGRRGLPPRGLQRGRPRALRPGSDRPRPPSGGRRVERRAPHGERQRGVAGAARPGASDVSHGQRDAVAVLEEMGLAVRWEESERALPGRDRGEIIASARRLLCVGADRDAEIEALLGPDFEHRPRRIMTVWWNGEANQPAAR